MLYSAYLLKESFSKLEKIQKGITKTSDMESLTRRLKFEYRNALGYYNDLISIIDNYYLDDIIESKESFKDLMDMIITMDNPEQISTYLKNLLRLMSGFNQILERRDKYDLNYYYKQKAFDYDHSSNIDEDDLSKVVNSISSYRKVNMLDCRTKTGFNGSNLKRMFESKHMKELILYGMEVNVDLANKSKDTKAYYKMAKGGINYSKCSNAVFDIVFDTPDYNAVATFNEQSILKTSTELSDLRRLTLFLKFDGILVFSMPRYRIDTKIANFLAKNYKNLSLIKQSKEESMVIIMAQRKLFDNNGDEEIFNKLRSVSLDEIDCDNEFLKYEITDTYEEVTLFRGSILDESDVIEITNSTNLLNNFMKKQSVEHQNNKIQPLLPFNLGQIGLVLTSGCLDGVIEELDGQCHVIKGAVKKEAVTEKLPGEKRGEEETRTTYINKVQIKILTPDGTIKTLA